MITPYLDSFDRYVFHTNTRWGRVVRNHYRMARFIRKIRPKK